MIIGGGTFTFVKALGGKDSICEDDKQELAWNFKIGKKKLQIIPVDVVAANAFSNDAETKIVNVDSILTDGKV
jgi:phosphoglycerate kinase